MDFTGKNVLITGASRGIGKATAMAFAKKGAKVGINYRSNDEDAQKTLAALPGDGHQLFKRDISQKIETKALINDFVKEFGQLDVLVNNAGISIFHEIDQVDFDHWTNAWKKTFETNLFAVANLCYWSAKAMMKTGGGHIVSVSSRGAFRGEPTKPAYGASKAALNSMSQSLAKKLAPHHIYVGVVAPGFTETEMAKETLTPAERENLLRESPFKRMAQPEEVAHAILFLASSEAAYSSGTIIDVNGASYLR
ncbi:3-oxoacyl-(acyl-carrier-protein) reductase [Allomuricauda ruestringensis DSM 13258]|uniref:3-oxoacyl-(Acyl-carrier-protein) reductase n=1 Tax=Allomuricauda ruestringensis (strain DSM 13258 / CIP 107369 / LMG 19739 / B1) TaxID=886377 RepID=G2PI32_ALLRU|nr:SDR family NAD(P)-dependent oxidoreductase [Allomuricauda ruestringensis]AEM70606.1 3-oxoacyl-(acyl-carrier-protein) reductase [Allomuricauda ruestringensis DSM 13258]